MTAATRTPLLILLAANAAIGIAIFVYLGGTNQSRWDANGDNDDDSSRDSRRRRLLGLTDPRTVETKITPSDICDYNWAMYGPEDHYDSNYWQMQKDTGRVTGEKVASKLKRQLPATTAAGSVVADIGCGGGFALTHFNEASTRYCFEINEAAIAEHPPNVVSVSRWSHLENDSVDVMYSIHSFEHHPHPLLSLQCAMSKLKPGSGIMYLEVPMEHGGCNVGDNDYGRFFDVPNMSFHIYTWNPRTLGQFMLAAGFVDISCIDLRPLDSTYFTDHPYHTASIWCLGRRP